MKAMTLKQMERENFQSALTTYKAALASKDAGRIVMASLLVRTSCRNERDRRAANQSWKEANGQAPTTP